MARLNEAARAAIVAALQDNATIFESLSGDEKLPQRLRSQFAAQRHLNETLAKAIEGADEVSVLVDPTIYRALIWD